MKKQPTRAIAMTYGRHARTGGGMPPGHHHETALDRFFTGLSRMTGLSAQARRTLMERINLAEETAGVQLAQKLQYLTQLQNKIVDGGWNGLWTSLRVCLGTA